MDDIQWQSEIYKRAVDIGDVNLQRRVWSGCEPEIVVSVSAFLSQLYDDLVLEDFIDEQRELENYELIGYLESFDQKLECYPVPEGSDLEVLNDPKRIAWLLPPNY